MTLSPDTDAWRVLQLVAERDGQRTVRRLSHLLEPWPARPIPHVPGALAARRAARSAHSTDVRARVRRALAALVREGLVARVGSVVLWPDARERFVAEGPASLARLAPIASDGDWLAPTPLVDPTEHAVAIVRVLVDGPRTVGELADETGGRTPSGAVSGAWQRTYRRLCLEQVVRPPRARRLTPAGWAVIREAAGAAA